MTDQPDPEDTCRPVEIDGETIRVRGAAELTDEGREALAALVQVAKAKFAEDAPEQVGVLQNRLRLAHQARRAKEHQLDDIRRALCGIGFMQDDDPYSHADLADVIRQNGQPATEATQPAKSPLREQIAAAIYEKSNPGYRWADAHPDDVLAYGADADAALKVIEGHLDIGEAEAWCKTCRRVWDGPRHQCESDAEQQLARVQRLLDTGPIGSCCNHLVRAAVDQSPPAPATTAANDWYDAGCARDCSEQHTYEWGRCAHAPESAKPTPTISILRVEESGALAKDIVARDIPLTAWDALITVAKWVSRGRSYAFDSDPDISPAYPDAAARHALGALDDAGLLDRPETAEAP